MGCLELVSGSSQAARVPEPTSARRITRNHDALRFKRSPRTQTLRQIEDMSAFCGFCGSASPVTYRLEGSPLRISVLAKP